MNFKTLNTRLMNVKPISPKWKRILFFGALLYTLIPMIYVDLLYISFAAPYFVGEAYNLPLYIQFYGHNNAGRFLHLFITNGLLTLCVIIAQSACIIFFVQSSRRKLYNRAFGGLILFALTGFMALAILLHTNIPLYNLF